MAGLEAGERIALAVRLFGRDLAVATSFGPTSGVMLSLAHAVCGSIRVITVRHGHETLETLAYADGLRARWNLDVRIYRGEYLPVPPEGTAAFHEFQHRAKVAPFWRALREERVRAWMSGVMRAESSQRKEFEFVMMRNGTPVFYPILDWNRRRIDEYHARHGIPILRDYYDPTKGEGQNLECGLHWKSDNAVGDV
jgi:phosphoadenosine phosphosulfate reductase